MNETASIDSAIDQVERLYRSITGRDAPSLGQEPYATIPPEKIPEEHVQEQVDRLVEKLAGFSTNPGIAGEWKPPISLWEGRDEIFISVDLPGVPRDAVRVAVGRGLLEISGSRQDRPGQNGDSLELKYAEHPFGKFSRTIPLPLGARTDQLQAQMRGGLLEIHIPREAGAKDAKTIHIG